MSYPSFYPMSYPLSARSRPPCDGWPGVTADIPAASAPSGAWVVRKERGRPRPPLGEMCALAGADSSIEPSGLRPGRGSVVAPSGGHR